MCFPLDRAVAAVRVGQQVCADDRDRRSREIEVGRVVLRHAGRAAAAAEQRSGYGIRDALVGADRRLQRREGGESGDVLPGRRVGSLDEDLGVAVAQEGVQLQQHAGVFDLGKADVVRVERSQDVGDTLQMSLRATRGAPVVDRIVDPVEQPFCVERDDAKGRRCRREHEVCCPSTAGKKKNAEDRQQQ